MTQSTQDSMTAYSTALLLHYCFELGAYQVEQLVQNWLDEYPANWVRLAVIEALYQGRYKVVSVEQFLVSWKRRGQPIYHFNHDFERLIGRNLPQNFTELPDLPALEQRKISSRLTPQEPKKTIRTGLDSLPEVSNTPQKTNLNAHEDFLESLDDTRGKSVPSSLESSYQEESPASSNTEAQMVYQPDWLRWEVRKQPIHQFTPSGDVSKFYMKLKAVAQQHEQATR